MRSPRLRICILWYCSFVATKTFHGYFTMGWAEGFDQEFHCIPDLRPNIAMLTLRSHFPKVKSSGIMTLRDAPCENPHLVGMVIPMHLIQPPWDSRASIWAGLKEKMQKDTEQCSCHAKCKHHPLKCLKRVASESCWELILLFADLNLGHPRDFPVGYWTQ